MPDPAPLGRTAAALLAWLDVRGRLVMLARQGLVEAEPAADRRARVAYSATAEGRRRAEIGKVCRQ